MEEIEFNDGIDENMPLRKIPHSKRTSFRILKKINLIKGVRKIGIARSDVQAYYILLGVAILLCIIMIGIIIYSFFFAAHNRQLPENIPPWLQQQFHNNVKQK